jgi:cytochrome P450
VSDLPPGPLWGRPRQTGAWIFRPGPFLWNARQRHGDTFTITIGQEPPWVILTDPDDVRTVFTGDPAILHAGKGNKVLRPVLGHHSVLIADHPAHLPQRKLLLPPFHGDRMAGYARTMREIAKREITGWDGEVATAERMQSLTLSVILRTVFGVEDTGEMRDAVRTALKFIAGPKGIAAMVLLGPEGTERFGVLGRPLKPVDDLIAAEIERRRQDPGEDVLSMLLEARHEDGAPMTDQEIRDELMTLLLAGHETTATGLAWAVERLARHPDAWRRLRDEGEPYADMVVKETLRLRPVVPIVVRNLQADFGVAGRTIPSGTSLVPCIWLVHRREDLYPDPHAFRPERWEGVKPGTYTWIPFGGGVRRCLGAAFAELEMRIVLQALAERHATIRPIHPEAEGVRRRAITLTPARGARVTVGTGGPRPV